MRIMDAFPSNYMKAGDLDGREWKLTMSRVEMENLGSDSKPVLYFHGAEKGLVLNKTNTEMIVMMYGDETNEWSGKELVIRPDKTQFQGKVVDCIRVVWTARTKNGGVMPAGAAAQAPAQAPTAQPAQQQPVTPASDDPLGDDAIPF